MQSGKLSPASMMTPQPFTTALLLPHLYLHSEPSRVVFIYSPSCIHLWKACSIQNTLEIFIVSFNWAQHSSPMIWIFFYPCHPITDEETEAQVGHVDGESQDWEPDTGLLLDPQGHVLLLYTLMTYLMHEAQTQNSWLLVRLSRFSLGKHAGEADKKIT